MRDIRSISNPFIFAFLFFHVVNTAHADIKKPIDSLLSNLKDVTGRYQGEVRLQSPDGLLNRIITPHTELNLSISGDELIVKSNSDLLGNHCQSKVLSIRELSAFPSDQSEILRAIFDFDSGRCFSQFKSNAILVLLRKDSNQGYTLETLLLSSPHNFELREQLNQKELIHGYFTKEDSNPLISRNY